MPKSRRRHDDRVAMQNLLTAKFEIQRLRGHGRLAEDQRCVAMEQRMQIQAPSKIESRMQIVDSISRPALLRLVRSRKSQWRRIVCERYIARLLAPEAIDPAIEFRGVARAEIDRQNAIAVVREFAQIRRFSRADLAGSDTILDRLRRRRFVNPDRARNHQIEQRFDASRTIFDPSVQCYPRCNAGTFSTVPLTRNRLC